MEENKKDKQHWMLFVLMLKNIIVSKNIMLTDLEVKTGIELKQLKIFFNLKKCPSLDEFIRIAKAIQVNFFFQDKENKTDLTIMFEAAMSELGRRTKDLPEN